VFFFALFLSLITIVSTSVLALASGENSFEKIIQNELDFYQQNKFLSEEEKIENIIRLYFVLKAEQMKTYNKDFRFSDFYNYNSKNKKSLEFISNKTKLQKEIRKKNNTTVLWQNITLDFVSTEVSDNIAKIKVYEKYEFILDTSDRHISGKGLEYVVTMQKYDNKWLIDDIITNSSFDEAFKESGIDIDKTIANMNTSPLYNKQVLEKEIEVLSNENYSNLTSDWTSQSLNTSNVFAYALTYALSYNPRFYSYAGLGGDCQDFGSQCLWFGFGGENTQTAINDHDWPMIEESTNRDWFQGSTYLDCDTSWIRVEEFDDYITSGGTGKNGPYGSVISGISYARKGDIIQVDWTGNGYFDHTFVVDSVVYSSTYGSRTMSDIYVSAHTADVRSDLMSDLGFSSSSTFRTLQINGTGQD